MNRKFFVQSGKKGQEAKELKNFGMTRYELLKIVSSQVDKSDLNWIQAKWKTAQIKLLVDSWKKFKN